MEVSELVKKYLGQGRMMQIATSCNGQPWICTVYFVEDDAKLYWLSLPSRRHSQEIAKHNKIAVAIAVKFDKNPIIGIQAEGTAEPVNDADEIKKIMKIYAEKYNRGQDFYNNFVAGKNEHSLYKFTPAQYSLFDEMNFTDGQKHEWNL